MSSQISSAKLIENCNYCREEDLEGRWTEIAEVTGIHTVEPSFEALKVP